MILSLGFLSLFLAFIVSANVIKRVDFGRYNLGLFDTYKVPNEHVNRLDQPIGVYNNLSWPGFNYLKPAARAPNATYGAPSLGNVAAMVEGSNASITANFDGSTISLFDFGSFKWGCVVGERTGLDDDPIEVTGMIPGCNLTLTAYIGQSQVAQQTVRYAPTRMSYPDYVTYILMMASATQTSRIRKVETVTFTLTYPAEALGDSQLAGLYLDDFTTYAYSRVEFLDF